MSPKRHKFESQSGKNLMVLYHQGGKVSDILATETGQADIKMRGKRNAAQSVHNRTRGAWSFGVLCCLTTPGLRKDIRRQIRQLYSQQVTYYVHYNYIRTRGHKDEREVQCCTICT